MRVLHHEAAECDRGRGSDTVSERPQLPFGIVGATMSVTDSSYELEKQVRDDA